MKLWLLLFLAAPASAGVVGPAVRAAPSAPAGAASLGSPAVSFDGSGPLKPWIELPGTPFVQRGAALIDTRAFGARELLKAVDGTNDRPVIGIFDTRSDRVLNSFAIGSFGVLGHADAVPPGLDRGRLGGYVYHLRPDGRSFFMGSGTLPAEITPAIERAVLRHLGVRPARLSPAERLRRLWLRVLDWASALGQ